MCRWWQSHWPHNYIVQFSGPAESNEKWNCLRGGGPFPKILNLKSVTSYIYDDDNLVSLTIVQFLGPAWSNWRAIQQFSNLKTDKRQDESFYEDRYEYMSWGQAQPPPACVSCCHVPSMCSLLVHGENPANAPKVKDKLLVRDQCAIFWHGWESQIFQKEMSKYGWLRQFSSSYLSCSITLHSYPFLLGIPNGNIVVLRHAYHGRGVVVDRGMDGWCVRPVPKDGTGKCQVCKGSLFESWRGLSP